MNRLLTLITAITVLGLSLVSFSNTAQACSCFPADDPEEQERAMDKFDVIATIEILDVELAEKPSEPQSYFVRILQLHKGTTKFTEFEIKDSSNSTCGNYYARGSTQLVAMENSFHKGYRLYNQCDQILLDAYMAGERDLNNGGIEVPSLDSY